MDDIIRSGIYAQGRAKTKDEADRAMAKTCFECDIKHVGHCYCDTGHMCYVERAHDEKLLELEEYEKKKANR